MATIFKNLVLLLIAGILYAPIVHADSSAAASVSTENVTEAKQFIKSRLKQIIKSERGKATTNVFTWDIVLHSLDNPWRWDTKQYDWSAFFNAYRTIISAISIDESFTYSLHPSDLSLPLFVKEIEHGYAIQIECRVSACISVKSKKEGKDIKGEKATPAYSYSVDERATKYYFYVEDKETADRVAVAMTVLLKSQGAKSRTF